MLESLKFATEVFRWSSRDALSVCSLVMSSSLVYLLHVCTHVLSPMLFAPVKWFFADGQTSRVVWFLLDQLSTFKIIRAGRLGFSLCILWRMCSFSSFFLPITWRKHTLNSKLLICLLQLHHMPFALHPLQAFSCIFVHAL